MEAVRTALDEYQQGAWSMAAAETLAAARGMALPTGAQSEARAQAQAATLTHTLIHSYTYTQTRTHAHVRIHCLDSSAHASSTLC
jgi:hypothetical protein